MVQLPLDAPLRDLNVGRALAEQGMARVMAAEPDPWFVNALEALRRFGALPGWGTFKVEDFRAWYAEQRLPAPHHFNVWGSFASRAAAAGVISWTRTYAPAVSPRTHSHPVKVWRLVR